MFIKLFGGDKKKKQQQQQVQSASPPSQQPGLYQQEIKFEATMNNLNMQIVRIEQSSEVIKKKLEKIDEDIRLLVVQKKKKQAKSKLMQAHCYRAQIDKLETQKNALIGMKIRGDTAQANQISVDVIGDVSNILKNQEKINDKMQEQMEDYQDIVQSQQEQDVMWKQLDLQKDMEDVNEEIQKYKQEVEQEQANKVAADFNNIPSMNIQYQPQQQQNYQPIKLVEQSKFENQMNMLLN